MASSGPMEMSRQRFALSYDGPNAGPIDVEALAPALLAVGRLIREANAQINGKKSKTKVVVTGDFESRCFHVNFDAVLGFFAAAQSFMGSDYAKDAKKVLQIIGFVKPEEGQVSLLRYLKMRAGKEIENRSDLTDRDDNGCVQIKIKGHDNKVNVHNTVIVLSENPKALRAARDAFAPIGQDGFEQLKIEDDSGQFAIVDPEETKAIIASCNAGIDEVKESDEDQEPDVEETPAWLSVYSPVYDVKADLWRFRLGRDVIYADISETMIAADAIERGGAMADDAYQVRLEITTPIDFSGKKGTPTYKVVEVIKFIPSPRPERQTSLFDD